MLMSKRFMLQYHVDPSSSLSNRAERFLKLRISTASI